MIILLSPAKDLSSERVTASAASTMPVLLEHSVPLVDKLRGYTAKRLGKLMSINSKLADLNHQRYQTWHPDFDNKNAIPAVFQFNGEAYRGLNARSFAKQDLLYAQDRLRILSGLYGVLRPLDLMLPYRLEMGTKLKVGRKKDLYAYWGERITQQLKADVSSSGSKAVINLASGEYAKAVDLSVLGVPVITPQFKDKVGAGYKMLMAYAKHQRGALSAFAIEQRIMDPEGLKDYTGNGYRYSAKESSDTDWVFLRKARK